MQTQRGPTPLGIFQNIPSPMVSRYLAKVGWDWIVLEMQHGSLTYETAYECIHTIRSAGSKPFVRVSIGNPAEIQRVLDLGAAGVVVPMINSRHEAQQAARAAKFPPLGARSVGGDFRYHSGRDYPTTANEDTTLLVQMEHIQSAEAIEDIVAVDGVDGCLVGPTDLAMSMGLGHADFADDPQLQRAIQRTLDACLRTGKIPVTNVYSLGEAEKRVEQGFRWITMRSEVDLFLDGARNLLSELRKIDMTIHSGRLTVTDEYVTKVREATSQGPR